MSKHYTAYQYDGPYRPKALRNWEVPKYYCDKPATRIGKTKVIANATGNLLPGVYRSEESPWGTFIGTWAMPRKIDRATAAILNGSANLKLKEERCYQHYSTKPTIPMKVMKRTQSFDKLSDKEKPTDQQNNSDQDKPIDEEMPPKLEQEPPKPICPIHD